jgi:hypothetical protein
MDAKAIGNSEAPRVIRMHADDNVAIVANDFGLPAGAQLRSGPALRERARRATRYHWSILLRAHQSAATML